MCVANSDGPGSNIHQGLKKPVICELHVNPVVTLSSQRLRPLKPRLAAGLSQAFVDQSNLATVGILLSCPASPNEIMVDTTVAVIAVSQGLIPVKPIAIKTTTRTNE